MTRVPVWVKDDDPVGTSEIEAEATSFCGYETEEDAAVFVELLDNISSCPAVDFSINSSVLMSFTDHILLNDVQQLKKTRNQR